MAWHGTGRYRALRYEMAWLITYSNVSTTQIETRFCHWGVSNITLEYRLWARRGTGRQALPRVVTRRSQVRRRTLATMALADQGGGEGTGDIEPPLPTTRPAEYDQMEKWLDEHPEFVHDYFARKAKRSMIDGWLIAHAISHSLGLVQSANSSGSNSRNNSGANTPVRKISAQEFEKGGLVLNPMISTVDGTPTFLGSNSSHSSSQAQTTKSYRRTKNQLKALDEKELMYELVMDICNDLDVTSLCYKILHNVCILLHADRCSLFLVEGKGTNEKSLVSKLFDVNGETTLEELSKVQEEIRIPWGTGIIGYVAEKGEVVDIPDAYKVSFLFNFS
ncbi:hypothetical protein CHS0354_017408 [Potamilus streckersoni]|uniref:GAF domain-containing protein n=1 Tax=Potamilus streckersoni TaxID=2493646 RepID=A0AAE0VTV0_9BIVA|nr:hypothetical protein CHS0354_017408 [Potamilus streckersoni]